MRGYIKIPKTINYIPFDNKTDSHNASLRKTTLERHIVANPDLKPPPNSIPVKSASGRPKASLFDWMLTTCQIDLEYTSKCGVRKYRLKHIISKIQDNDPSTTKSETKQRWMEEGIKLDEFLKRNPQTLFCVEN